MLCGKNSILLINQFSFLLVLCKCLSSVKSKNCRTQWKSQIKIRKLKNGKDFFRLLLPHCTWVRHFTCVRICFSLMKSHMNKNTARLDTDYKKKCRPLFSKQCLLCPYDPATGEKVTKLKMDYFCWEWT